MGIFLAAIGILCLYGLRFKTFHIEYLSQDATKAVNGIFVLLVFFRHYTQYVSLHYPLDLPMVMLDDYLGGLIVTTFLFYSGYAVMRSMETKENYVSTIPGNRILTTVLHFESAVMLFVLLNLVLGREMSLADVLIATTALRSIGNSTWYVFAIVVCWTATYLSFRFIKSTKAATAMLTLLVIAYIPAIRLIKPESCWWNTVMCYPLGIWFCLYKERIENIIMGGWKISWYLAVTVIFALLVLAYLFSPISNLKSMLFVLLVVVLTMKIQIGNAVLHWLGSHVFSIYILQRIPMILLTHFGINEHPYLFFALSAAATLPLAVGFDAIWKKIDVKIRKH